MSFEIDASNCSLPPAWIECLSLSAIFIQGDTVLANKFFYLINSVRKLSAVPSLPLLSHVDQLAWKQ